MAMEPPQPRDRRDDGRRGGFAAAGGGRGLDRLCLHHEGPGGGVAERDEAEKATLRAEKNVALSLEVFGDLFDKLASGEKIPTTPLGLQGPGRPMRPGGPPGGHGPGGGRRPPDADFPGDGPDGPPPEEMQAGNPEDDTQLLPSVLSFYDRFAQQNADAKNPRIQAEAARAYRKVGSLYHSLGREEESAKAIARAVAMLDDLVQQFPKDPTYRARLVEAYAMVDPWSADPSSLPQIEAWFLRARGLIDQLAAESPDDSTYAQEQIQVRTKLGAVLQGQDRPDDAEAAYREAIELAGSLLSRGLVPENCRLDRVAVRERLAALQAGRGRTADAMSTLDAIEVDLRALAKHRGLSRPISDHAASAAELYEKLGQPGRASSLTRWAATVNSAPSRGGPGPGNHGGPAPGGRPGPPRD